jgi:lysophospholipase L1-like esterase
VPVQVAAGAGDKRFAVVIVLTKLRTVAGRLLLAGSVFYVAAIAPIAQTVDPDPGRFASEIEAFRQWDTKNAFPADGLLFVGSSSIRLWDSAQRFPKLAIVNRGFGGSHISDVNHYIQDVALKYRPAAVVFYAGDNDINDGKTPERVLADYRAFVERVQAGRADTRIFFLAIKPSPARWAKWPTMRQANELVRAYSEQHFPRLVYVDVASPMLTADGRTQPHLYVEDGLHMTAAGYELWTSILGDSLVTSSLLKM